MKELTIEYAREHAPRMESWEASKWRGRAMDKWRTCDIDSDDLKKYADVAAVYAARILELRHQFYDALRSN